MTDKIHAALLEIRDLVDNALRDYSENKHWMNYLRAHHANGTSYDRDGGSSSSVNDIAGRIIDPSDSPVRVYRADPGSRAAKRYRKAALAGVGAMRDIDSLRRQLLTAKNALGFAGDNDAMWCRAHLEAGSREPRATGDECRACADFRRTMKRKPTKEEIDLRSRTGRWPRTTTSVA